MSTSITEKTIRILIEGVESYYFDAYLFMYTTMWPRGLSGLVMALTIAFAGYKLLFGKSDAPKALAIKAALFMVVNSIVFHTTMYHLWIRKPFLSLVTGLSSAFSNLTISGDYLTGITGTMDSARTMLSRVFEQIAEMSILNIFKMLPDMVILFFAIVLFAFVVFIMFIYVMYLIIALNVMFLLGPFALMFGCFDMTRQFFFQWTKALSQYGIHLIVLGILSGILNATTRTLWVIPEGGFDQYSVNDSQGFSMFMVSALIVFLMKNSGEMASQVAGGLQAGIGSFGNSANITNLNVDPKKSERQNASGSSNNQSSTPYSDRKGTETK